MMKKKTAAAGAAAATRTVTTMGSAGPGPLRGGSPAPEARRPILAPWARARRRSRSRTARRRRWRGRKKGSSWPLSPSGCVEPWTLSAIVPASFRSAQGRTWPFGAPTDRTRRRRRARRARLRREISAHLAAAEQHQGGGGQGRRRPERERRPRPHGAPEQPAHGAGGEAREPRGRVVQTERRGALARRDGAPDERLARAFGGGDVEAVGGEEARQRQARAGAGEPDVDHREHAVAGDHQRVLSDAVVYVSYTHL